MFWYGPGMGGWGFGIMMAGSALLWAAVIVGAVMFVRVLSPSRHSVSPATTSAEQLLAERFARGEIDEREYRTRLETLRGSTPPVDDHGDV